MVQPGEGGQGRFSEVAGAVLTGGASSRMGRDKAHLAVAGVASATRITRLFATFFEEVLLVGGDPPAAAPGRRVVDPAGPVCALRGLVTALESAVAPRVLVAATDLPLLTPQLVLALVAWPEADAVVPRSQRGREALCAIYARDAALPRARAHLASGRLALHQLLDELQVAELTPADLRRVDPDGRALFNLNSPDDLARLQAFLPGG